MNRLGGVTRRRALYGLAALIVIGGFGLALLTTSGVIGSASQTNQELLNPTYGLNGAPTTYSGSQDAGLGTNGWEPVTTSATTTFVESSTTTTSPGYPAGGESANVTLGSSSGSGGMIEFSTDLAITATAPEQTASAVSAIAYSFGGYVAYQSTYTSSAYVVIRVPSADYQKALSQVLALGTFVSESSNSNDVSVQYTDMNATLESLVTEQGALLKLLNQTAAINSTLQVESQLQQVNQQINDVESQILQTRTLIDYATIDVTVTQTAQSTPLVLSLSAIPANGTAPLSVTFNAIVKGGAQPYVVNYNFGDGTAAQGQILIHTYNQAGDYTVVVSATDQNGTVVQRATTIKVVASPATTGVGGFLGFVGGLFLNVVEGIVEVAVVVLPLAAIAAAIVIPIQRRGRTQKSIKQSQ